MFVPLHAGGGQGWKLAGVTAVDERKSVELQG